MDLLESGPERAPRRLPRPDLPRPVAALLAAAAAVALAGAASVPSLRAQTSTRATSPTAVTVTTSGGSASGGRLRVWLLLEGPPSAELSEVRGRLPGSVVETSAPDAFSPRGLAVVRLDVTPACPVAVAGLTRAAVELTLGSGDVVRVRLDADGILASTVRSRCLGEAAELQARGPLVRLVDSGLPGVLRTVVDLGAPGPEVLVVTAVTPAAGLVAESLSSLPLRVAPGSRGQLVVDLRADGCSADSAAPPYLLDSAADGEVEPRAEPALRTRLAELRREGCPRG